MSSYALLFLLLDGARLSSTSLSLSFRFRRVAADRVDAIVKRVEPLPPLAVAALPDTVWPRLRNASALSSSRCIDIGWPIIPLDEFPSTLNIPKEIWSFVS